MKRINKSNMGENVPPLLKRFGLLINSSELATLLGYPSLNAFRTAVYRGMMPVRLFKIKGRRGKFALTSEVEAWLTTLEPNAEPSDQVEGGAS